MALFKIHFFLILSDQKQMFDVKIFFQGRYTTLLYEAAIDLLY